MFFPDITGLDYYLPKIKLTIFDIRGQEIITLSEGYQSMGHHELQWSGLDQAGQTVSTGVYLCRLISDNSQQTIKMLYLR